MDCNQQCCHNSGCPDVGKTHQGNIKVYSYQERRYYCVTCGHTFSASRGSTFYRLHADRQDFIEAVGMLAERCSLRGIARIKAVKTDTVLHWLEMAGTQAATVSRKLIQHLHLTQVQIDELWTFVKKSHATSKRTKRSPASATIGSGRLFHCRRGCA